MLLSTLLSKQFSTPPRLLFDQTKLEQTHEQGRWKRTQGGLHYSFFFTHNTSKIAVLCSFRNTNLINLISEQPADLRLHEASGTFLGIVCSLMRSVHLNSLPAANDKRGTTATTGPVLSAFPLQTSICCFPHCTGKIRGQFVSEYKCRSLTMGWLL